MLEEFLAEVNKFFQKIAVGQNSTGNFKRFLLLSKICGDIQFKVVWSNFKQVIVVLGVSEY